MRCDARSSAPRRAQARRPALGQRSRKRRRADEAEDFSARYRARSEARNEAARASLEPLEPGERPRAVTIGALVALALGVANLVFLVAGGEVGGDRPAAAGAIAYSALMFVAAWGQWRARYWAVLGMQALLALIVLLFAVLLVRASNVLGVVISLAIVVAGGALFWFNVRAMARIQMPERR